MLLTSSVNPFGVSNTLQIKVSLDIDNVLTIFTLPYIDMSRDDQMVSIFLSLGNFSKKFLLVASSSSYEKYTPKVYTVSSLNFNLEWNPFSDAMIPAKVFLIKIDLFVDQNSSQIVAADQRAYEQTEYLSQKPLCHRRIGLFL